MKISIWLNIKVKVTVYCKLLLLWYVHVLENFTSCWQWEDQFRNFKLPKQVHKNQTVKIPPCLLAYQASQKCPPPWVNTSVNAAVTIKKYHKPRYVPSPQREHIKVSPGQQVLRSVPFPSTVSYTFSPSHESREQTSRGEHPPGHPTSSAPLVTILSPGPSLFVETRSLRQVSSWAGIEYQPSVNSTKTWTGTEKWRKW